MKQLTGQDPTHIGPYRLIARLGEGGMGLVYLGRSDLGRTVAVKVVQAEHAQNPEFRSRFSREVAAARRVGGAWTAAVLDADTEAAVPWVATQYIPGPDLASVVGRDFGPLPEPSVRTLANRLALALQAVHEAGLIHRDLKPSNVLVTVDGPRVIDFGIARALDSTGGDSLLTRTGMLIGSPGFMSPEQVRGQQLTPASDMFCLGAVLVYAATGRLLFGATDTGLNAHLFRIAEEEADLTGVPDALLGLVRACLEKDPAKRPTPAQVVASTSTDLVAEWLPNPVLAQLGRKAAELLDFVPQVRDPLPGPLPDPRAAAALSVAPPQPQPTSYALSPATPPAAPPPHDASRLPAPSVPSGPVGPADDETGPQGRRGWALAMAVLAQLVVLTDLAAFSFLSPALTGGPLPLRWMFVGYAMAFGALLFVGGHLADLIGRKPTLLIGLGGFAACAAALTISTSPGVLVGGQVLKGAFAGLIAPAALSLVAGQFTTPKGRRSAIGLYAAVDVGGFLLSRFLEVPLDSVLSVEAPSLVTLPTALLALLGTAALVRDVSRRRPPARFDTPGALLSAFGIAALVLACAEATYAGWSPATALFLGCGIALTAGFARQQSKAGGTILPVGPRQSRDRRGAWLSLFLIGLALPAMAWPFERFVYSNYGQPSTVAGSLLTVAAFLVGALAVSARLLPRVGPRALLATGLVIAAAGSLLELAVGDSIALGIPGMVCAGIGLGIAGTVLYSTVLDGIAARDSGGPSALVLVSRHVGAALGFALVSGLLPGLGQREPSNQYLAAGALLAAALIGGLTLRARSSDDESGGVPGGAPAAPFRVPAASASGPAPQVAPGRTGTSGLLLVRNGRVERIPWALSGLDLLQEVGRLLRAEHLTMVKLGTDLTLWHAGTAGSGSPNPAASRLMAAYGFQAVTGPVVVAGRLVGHDPFPLGADEIDGVARRLER